MAGALFQVGDIVKIIRKQENYMDVDIGFESTITYVEEHKATSDKTFYLYNIEGSRRYFNRFDLKLLGRVQYSGRCKIEV
jgi:hypothetical protein